MKIENIEIHRRDIVRVKKMGKITELMFTNHVNSNISIRRLDGQNYVDLNTGEVKQFKHISNRSDALNEIRQSLGRLRDYINTNVHEVENCRWITLTYAENMTDPVRLYKDFEKFWKKFKYKYGKNIEYISCCEPQGRGAWHIHLLAIFDKKAPFIPNNEVLFPMWGHGFTSIHELKNVTNVGVYLTAYLTDIELGDCTSNYTDSDIKEVDVQGVKKRIVKGGRLHLYPPKFNIYRCSRGIKKPEVCRITEEEAQKNISAATLTFEKTIRLVDEQLDKIISYRYYNQNLCESQD